jgi:hypothetical protein
MDTKINLENRELTIEEAEDLTNAIRDTIIDYFSESKVGVSPCTYNCYRSASPIFYPRISIQTDTKRIGYIEINLR